MMRVPTVVTESGFYVRVFTRDGGEPHVHVAFGGKLIKVFLAPVAPKHSGCVLSELEEIYG